MSTSSSSTATGPTAETALAALRSAAPEHEWHVLADPATGALEVRVGDRVYAETRRRIAANDTLEPADRAVLAAVLAGVPDPYLAMRTVPPDVQDDDTCAHCTERLAEIWGGVVFIATRRENTTLVLSAMRDGTRCVAVMLDNVDCVRSDFVTFLASLQQLDLLAEHECIDRSVAVLRDALVAVQQDDED
jgi:hypothetical protein